MLNLNVPQLNLNNSRVNVPSLMGSSGFLGKVGGFLANPLLGAGISLLGGLRN